MIVQRWATEPIDKDFGVFDTNDQTQYIAMGLDHEQAEVAAMMLNYDGLGDPTKLTFEQLQEELYYQLERVPCPQCTRWVMRAELMPDGPCRECQS